MWQTAGTALRNLASTVVHMLTGCMACSFACLKGIMPPHPWVLIFRAIASRVIRVILPAWLASAPREWELFASEQCPSWPPASATCPPSLGKAACTWPHRTSASPLHHPTRTQESLVLVSDNAQAGCSGFKTSVAILVIDRVLACSSTCPLWLPAAAARPLSQGSRDMAM